MSKNVDNHSENVRFMGNFASLHRGISDINDAIKNTKNINDGILSKMPNDKRCKIVVQCQTVKCQTGSTGSNTKHQMLD